MTRNARERGCGILCVEHVDQAPEIVIHRDGQAHAQWSGLMKCGHIWTCPVCSSGLRAERAERVIGAVDELGGRWQMLTLTLRHRNGVPLKKTRDAMADAWRRVRQGGRIQRVWSDRVTATVRSQEVTFGDNGWHPHLHVLMRTTEWDDDEKDALQARWERQIERALGPDFRPDDRHGLYWSEPFDGSSEAARAGYLAKLGLEIVGVGKEGRNGSRTPWQIAQDAVDGDQRSVLLWWEYSDATRGKRAIELDERAQAAALANRQKKREDNEGGEPAVHIEIARDDVRALRRLEHRIGDIMAILLRAAEEGGESAVREWIAYARADAARHSGGSEGWRDRVPLGHSALESGHPP